jgi:PadR family transcriptional regulator, regulatory protein PadR
MKRSELLQGTLDLLILRTLAFGPAHGHSIAKHIRASSGEVLQVEAGSLYPALHRLEKRSLIASKWDHSDLGKRARFYRLTTAGRRQLASEQSIWEQLSGAIARVLRPA